MPRFNKTKKRLLSVFFLALGCFSQAQECPGLTEPLDGSVDVPVNTPVTWNAVNGVIGYIVSLGTTPGGGEIINRRSSGQSNFYIPEVGLPEDTRIYVTIRLFLFGQPVRTCTVQSFVTEDVTTPPQCTTLIQPLNNEGGVRTDTPIKWNYSPTATGYLLTIGTAADPSNILSNFDIGNQLFYESADDLPLDEDIFVKIVPYNENGNLEPCIVEQFSTDASSNICDPRFDSSTGEIVSERPHINFPDIIGLCKNSPSTRMSSRDTADGYRWFKLNDDGTETLVSESSEVSLREIGRYRYELYNLVQQAVGSIECSQSKEFEVVLSEAANIIEITVDKGIDTRKLTVVVEGLGLYEYAIDDPNGPYQASNVFRNIKGDAHILYVRDINGCGTVQQSAPKDLSTDDFPKFFTPNSDNTNDTWQFVLPKDAKQFSVATIYIFDRYGNLLAQVDPKSRGWDGSFRGRPLPSSTYWYRAVALNGEEIKGHFALKR